jgi:hypothetical protein
MSEIKSEEIKIRSLNKYESDVLRAALTSYLTDTSPTARLRRWATETILNDMLPNLLWREK